MSPYEQRVREFAYQIWEAEGRPAGHEYRHWEMACKLAEVQDAALKSATQKNSQQLLAPVTKKNSAKEKRRDVQSTSNNKKLAKKAGNTKSG